MRIAYVEDVPEEREYILSLIKRWQKENNPTGQVFGYSSAQSFLFDYGEKTFDVIILDIKMEEMSGMELAKKLREEQDDTIISFITGEKEYVFEGYDVEAIDYILKPVDERKIYSLLNKVKKKLKNREKTIIVEAKDGIITVPISKIMFIEVRDHKTYVNTEMGVFETGKTLSKWEEELSEEPFIKPHRSFLVHCGWITQVRKKELTVSSKYDIPIARGQWEKVAKALLDYRRHEVWE